MKNPINWPACAITFSLIIIIWRQFSDLHEYSDDLEKPVTVSFKEHFFQSKLDIGEIESNCGRPELCPDGTISLALSTGYKENGEPEFCIGGKYLLQKNINGGGRGLNGIIIEPTLFQIISVRNFDTYRYDSNPDVDQWLETIIDNDILVLFTSDEASSRLNCSTRQILKSLGSAKIQDLSYRGQWFIVTQKGSPGFAVYENISFPKSRSAWGEELRIDMCLPRHIPKELVTIDPPAKENRDREKFCQGRTEFKYKAFCTAFRFQTFTPALLTNRSLIGNPIFSVPIIVFASPEFELFVSTIDSLIHQPGILTQGITVFYEELGETDISEVCALYKIQAIPIELNLKRTKFPEKLEFVREFVKHNIPDSKHFIMMEPYVLPGPDFLYYFAQLFPIMLKDPTITAISPTTPHCYKTYGNVHSVYRVEGIPKFTGLFPVKPPTGSIDIIVPDVPRMQGPEFCHIPNIDIGTWLDRPQDLTKERYFHKLVMLQQVSTYVDVYDFLRVCGFTANSNYYVMYFQDDRLLFRILVCMNIFNNDVGSYEGTYRLSYKGKHVFIIHSNSTFYKARPITPNTTT